MGVVWVGKKRRSFSLDEDLKRQLDKRENLNASAVVNELLRQYLAQGEAQDIGLRMRQKDIEREIEDVNVEISRLESRREELKREYDEIQSQIDQRRQEGVEEIAEVVDRIEAGSWPRESLAPDNPAVQNWATKASMTPERFIREVERKLDE